MGTIIISSPDGLGTSAIAPVPERGDRRFAESHSEFDVWFKERCKEIFLPEIDFNQPLPPITEIFDSQQALVAR